jgi:hypothetical protein
LQLFQLSFALRLTTAGRTNDAGLRTLECGARRRNHRRACSSRRRNAGDPACAAGQLWLRAGARDSRDRFRVESVARRSPRRGHLLPRFPPRTRRPPRAETLPRRSLPGRGGDALAARAEAKLGIAIGNTTADQRTTLEPIYCLGLCATAPSAMLDGRVVGRLDEARIDALLAEAQR